VGILRRKRGKCLVGMSFYYYICKRENKPNFINTKIIYTKTMIKVYKVKKKILLPDHTQKEAWIYKQLEIGSVSFRDLMTECMRSCGITTSQAAGAAEAFSNRIAFYIENGHGVRIDGVGTFKPVINSVSAPTAKELPSANEAARVKVRFFPHRALQEAVANNGFEYDKTLDEE